MTRSEEERLQKAYLDGWEALLAWVEDFVEGEKASAFDEGREQGESEGETK